LLYKRLEQRRIVLPATVDGDASTSIDAHQLAQLLDGVKTRMSAKEIVREARAKISPITTTRR
jgi:hypothetical protein